MSVSQITLVGGALSIVSTMIIVAPMIKGCKDSEKHFMSLLPMSLTCSFETFFSLLMLTGIKLLSDSCSACRKNFILRYYIFYMSDLMERKGIAISNDRLKNLLITKKFIYNNVSNAATSQ
ncbi:MULTISPECIES: hypothetical protein [Candidatus Ichthyocystis]|uniref:hypothetical protein n=1 Tax=Candidatus Ichthyocystis TaxID=2929841 RepID=UPI000B8447F6|nr:MULTISPECIES: hypothetical protein [Ichthyocystis]